MLSLTRCVIRLITLNLGVAYHRTVINLAQNQNWKVTMKILKANNGAQTSLTLSQREWQVNVDAIDNEVFFKIDYDFETQGRIIFSKNEVKEFVYMLEAFFPAGPIAAFNHNTQKPSNEHLATVEVSYTNWGEPYEQGIEVTSSHNFNDYSQDNLHFGINESGVRELLIFLKKQIKN